MKFLCKCGIHKWTFLDWPNCISPDYFLQCRRCGSGILYWQRGHTIYTPEQMQAWKDIAISDQGSLRRKP